MPTVELTDEEYSFIKDLAHELATQDNRATARPVLFCMRYYEDMHVPDGEGDTVKYYDPEYPEFVYEDLDIAIKCRMQDDDVCSVEEATEWAKTQLRKFDVKEVPFLEGNFFLTEKGFKEHEELNGHNFRKDQHSFVTHAFRNPEIEKLVNIVLKMGGQKPHDGY